MSFSPLRTRITQAVMAAIEEMDPGERIILHTPGDHRVKGSVDVEMIVDHVLAAIDDHA